MKINTYNKYPELYSNVSIDKTAVKINLPEAAGVATDAAKAVSGAIPLSKAPVITPPSSGSSSDLIKNIDSFKLAASPSLKSVLQQISDHAKIIIKDTDDAAAYADGVIFEAIDLEKAVVDSNFLNKFKNIEEALTEANRLYEFHIRRYREIALKNEKLRQNIGNISEKYNEAIGIAAAESGDIKSYTKQLEDLITPLISEQNKSSQRLKMASIEQKDLIVSLDDIRKNLKQASEQGLNLASLKTRQMTSGPVIAQPLSGQKAMQPAPNNIAPDATKPPVEVPVKKDVGSAPSPKAISSPDSILKKQNEKLVALYRQSLKDLDDAQKALQVAKQANMPQPTIQALDNSVDAKKTVVDAIGTKLSNGDSEVKKSLEAEAIAVNKKAPPITKTPDISQGTNIADPNAANPGLAGKMKDQLESIAIKSFGAGFGRLLTFAGYSALFAVMATTIYVSGAPTYLWRNYVPTQYNEAWQKAQKFDQALKDAHSKLTIVKFDQESKTQQLKQSYLDIMQSCFDMLPKMIDNPDNQSFITDCSSKLQILAQQTQDFLKMKDLYSEDLESLSGWNDALTAIQILDGLLQDLSIALQKIMKQIDEQTPKGAMTPASDDKPNSGNRPPPLENDKGIDVMDTKIYLSQYPELDPVTRSAAPALINKVLLSPTGLSFWDPNKQWGGGYLASRGTVSDQIINHVKFFLNPRAVDSDWAYGIIDSERKLRKFMRKNMPRIGRSSNSGYKETRKDFKRKRLKASLSSNITTSVMDLDMKNKVNMREKLEKISSSTNKSFMSTENIEKYADSVSKEYYQVALRGLDDQYAKSYYAGLKSMYDQKLGGGNADYKSLYEPHGETGAEILALSHPKSIVVSDAMGNGGLVENLIEQQRHSTNVALSTPTGNFRGKHANLIAALNKIANIVDKSGKLEISKIIDEASEDIVAILKANGTCK